MARKKISAATRERRRHQATRDLLWDRIDGVLRALWQNAEGGTGDEKQLAEVRSTLRVLRKTGAK